tara:strand:+ start:2352 stop:2948 length:597 start_codon:yes stop_codon:yes gene_type:complete
MEFTMRAKGKQYSPEDLIRDVKELLAREKLSDDVFSKIGEFLKKISLREDLMEIGEHRGKGINAIDSYVIYRDPLPDGPIIILAQFDRATEIHNHGTWGVMCAYKGREHYTQWKRKDNGEEAGKVDLELVKDLILVEGDIVWWPDVPNDIHKQDPIDDSMWQLVYMGRNTMGGDEQHYDPKLGTSWEADIPNSSRRRV